MCDYISLFSQVNREIIQGDKEKKERGKSTSRFKISSNFLQATEHIEKINEILNTICVRSISEVRHADGIDLPTEQQMKITDPRFEFRTIAQHFLKLSEIERNVLDLREYRVSQMTLRDQEGPLHKKKELFISKKSVYERALPLLVQEQDQGILEQNSRL